jgi:hypothetical protein
MTAPESLAVRMRAAADTIDEVNKRLSYGLEAAWKSYSLRNAAEQVEAEDAEVAEREALVEELAQQIEDGWHSRTFSVLARTLIESGWTKP